MKKIDLGEMHLDIEPKTRLLCIHQGDNVMKVTMEQVTALKSIKSGENSNGTYASKLLPRNMFKKLPNGTILAECKDQYNESVILLNRIGCKCIFDYAESHRGRIARDMDFR